MPGFLGIVGDEGTNPAGFDNAAATLDFLGRSPVSRCGAEGVSIAVAPLKGAPFRGPYTYENDRVLGAFAGDVFSQSEVPWEQIGADESDRHDWLDGFEGRFTVAVYEKDRKRLKLFADHFGCQPVFYSHVNGKLVFSTQLAAFVRLGVGGPFDEEWLDQFLYFAYWPLDRTYLANVRRLGPGSVLTYEAVADEMRIDIYEPRFRSQQPPLRGDEAIDHALDVFRSQVPPMFGDGEPVEFALSGGLDSRTLYAFLPDGAEHRTFTYGQPTSSDQKEAAITARRLGIPHRQLFFDETYLQNLTSRIHETVWLSGGLAWVNRAMLPAVYRFVAEGHDRPPIMSSGIALDTLFRGHNNARGDLNRVLSTGRVAYTDPAYGEMFEGARLAKFRDVVETAIADLTKQHGRLCDPESYLSYTVYTLCPSFFTADLEIGGHFAALRIPGYDTQIVKLAYELEHSTIYLSKFVEHSRFDEYILQSNLMASHSKLARVPLQNIPLDVYVRRDKLRYHLYRTVHHGIRRVQKKLRGGKWRATPEDWESWFATRLAGEMRRILGPGARIREYVRPEAVDLYLDQNRWRWLARLSSVELVLQMMDNGWERPDR